MSAEAEIFRHAVKFLCANKSCEDICRLCLRSTETEKHSFQEDMVIEKSYCSETLTFLDIFDEIGFYLDENLPNVFCSECATTVINAFLFKKLCQYSTEKWNDVLDKLGNSITDTENLNREVKTAFLNIEKNVTYATTKVIQSKNLAPVKLNALIKSRKHKKVKKVNLLLDGNDNCSFNPRKNTYQCSKCSKAFAMPKQLQGHIERMHQPKKMRCTKCEKKFSSQTMLKMHDYQHHIPVPCKLCFDPFPSRYKMEQHLAKHQKLTCPTCNKTYSNRNYYKIHIKTCPTEGVDFGFFYCDICGKAYSRKNSLRSHLKVEHGFGKVYTCSWCDKKFDAISRLNYHIVKHTKEKNYSCEICGCNFVSPAALVYHKRLHTGEKPFPCDLCDEMFLSASRRAEHKHRKHFGPQRKCPHCPMKFVAKSQLDKHVARHDTPTSKLYIMRGSLPVESIE